MRLKGQKPDWLLEAFDDRYDDIYAYLARRVGRDIAQDLASEVFAVAYRRRDTYNQRQGELAGWLFGIATNLLRGYRRAEERRLRAYARHGAPASSEGEVTDLTNYLDADSDRAKLSKALQQISEDHRDVLLLTCWAELTYPQVAEALSIPVGTVRSRLSRAREEMRELLTANSKEGVNYSEDMTWIS